MLQGWHCYSVTKSHLPLCNHMDCSILCSLLFTISQSLLRFMSIESMLLFNHLIPCLPLLLSAFNRSQHQGHLALCIRWSKDWNFNFSTSPSNEYSGLISFRINWFDLLAVQGTLKSLLQHHSLKSSVLQCSAFFMVHLSHGPTCT